MSAEAKERRLNLARERAKISNRKRRADPEYRVAEAKKNLARLRKYRTNILTLLGNQCTNCGLTDVRALQIDHIKGGGKREFKAYGGFHSMYLYYSQHPQEAHTNLQILCANCNWIKRAEKLENQTVIPRIGRPRMEDLEPTYQQLYNRKRRENPKYRAEERVKNLARNLKRRTDLIKLLGGKCVKCNFFDIRALQLDHILGGGTKEHSQLGNVMMYYKYLKYPEETKKVLQVLCANCNWIKRAEHGEKPTGRPRNVDLKQII